MKREHRWLAIGAAFGLVVLVRSGLDAWLMYGSSYLFALALGIDNALVISLMLVGARIPSADQTSVLRWSFACALGIRAAVLAGAVMLGWIYPDVHYAFGAWLVYEAIRSLRTDPFAGRNEQKSRGLLLSIALVELAFAADALGALAVTDMLFVLVPSNLLATAAIRSMSRTLMLWAPRLRPLRAATQLLLALSGAMLIARTPLHASPALTLEVVGTVLAIGFFLSRRRA